jgi:hypothetical protein
LDFGRAANMKVIKKCMQTRWMAALTMWSLVSGHVQDHAIHHPTTHSLSHADRKMGPPVDICQHQP